MPLVIAKNLTKTFGQVHALNGVSFELENSEQYVIQGASGSGKSTLLHLLAGLDSPTSGEIYVDNNLLSEMDDEALAAYRRGGVGLVFQFHFLLSSMTCFDNILLPARIANCLDKKLKKSVKDLAERLSVSHCLDKFPYEASGGEQQRINIIRALSLSPHLLLCDEPTGNLDFENSQNVLHLLQGLSKETGTTLVIVTHDSHIASFFPHKLIMRDGKLL